MKRPQSAEHTRRWPLLVAATLIGIGLGTAVVSVWRPGDDAAFVESPLIGRPAPPVTLEALDGSGPIHLPDPAGNITVVNFWASYCFPCRNEHGLLAQAAGQFESVNFVGVVFGDTPDRASEFLDELGRAYPHGLDPDAEAATRFGVFGIPATYFIDEAGIVVGQITGELQPGVMEDALDRMAGGERPGSRTLGTVTG